MTLTPTFEWALILDGIAAADALDLRFIWH
jgi:hypothetical protein